MSTISIEGVTKHWGAHAVLRGIDFTVERGALTVLLGPSGCGKSTTLRLIAGLEQVGSGRILIGARDVTGLPPSKRDVSMVFQSYALFPHLSVAENITFGLRVRKVSADERRRRLSETAELLGLGPLLERKPSQISGGQQQRVALGRAIVARKPICLMDEPLSNLDAQLRADMRREIRSLQQKLGITMVYVTHDQTEAMTMADQVVLLNAGAIEQDASPADLYARPASVFAARFVGAPPMNIVPREGLPGDAIGRLFPGGRGDAFAGIRPEDIRLDEERGIEARVDAVEYLGADSLLTCAIGAAALLCRVKGRTTLSPGGHARIGWSPEALHWFDGGTGKRIQQ